VRLRLPHRPEEPSKAEPGAKHGVNLPNFEPAILEDLHVRHFDGAVAWTHLDGAARSPTHGDG